MKTKDPGGTQISPVSVVTLFGDYLAFTVTVLGREASAGYRSVGARAVERSGCLGFSDGSCTDLWAFHQHRGDSIAGFILLGCTAVHTHFGFFVTFHLAWGLGAVLCLFSSFAFHPRELMAVSDFFLFVL